jgi:hypothetical protein
MAHFYPLTCLKTPKNKAIALGGIVPQVFGGVSLLAGISSPDISGEGEGFFSFIGMLSEGFLKMANKSTSCVHTRTKAKYATTIMIAVINILLINKLIFGPI